MSSCMNHGVDRTNAILWSHSTCLHLDRTHPLLSVCQSLAKHGSVLESHPTATPIIVRCVNCCVCSE